MKWLIVGTGGISESFVKSLLRMNEKPWYVLSRDWQHGQNFAQRNGIPNSGTDLQQALLYVDAVYIGTPNAVHYETAKQAIQSGKHVLIEKPMTHAYALTEELFTLGDYYNVKVMEAYAHITNPTIHPLQNKGNHLQANFMRVSSKIKNFTYQHASSFSKELFGGAIPDIGVYPISLGIYMYGPVKSFKIENIVYLNNVEVECDITLKHVSGQTTTSSISKLKDGDNWIYVDGQKQLHNTSYGDVENRMDAEIDIFVNQKDISIYRTVSLETARIVEEFKKIVNTTRN